MAPRSNFQLARIFGIRIGVGVSWFVVLFLFIFIVTPVFHSELGGSRTTAYLVAVASVLSFFASLVLHELGHALVARRSGLQVAGIDLWALGNEGVRATPAFVWLSWVATINVLVLAFNLVPAFPLDGGRIAHAIVWWR